MRKVLYLIIVMSFAVGCASGLRKDLNCRSCSLIYLRDSAPVETKTADKLFINSVSINDTQMRDETIVKKNGKLLIPLLVLNVWNFKYKCELGKNGIEGDIPEKIKHLFISESERSGLYQVTEDETSSNVFLELEIKDMKATGPYCFFGTIIVTPIFWVSNHKQTAGPATAEIKIAARLKSGENILLEKEYSSTESSQILKKGNITFKKLRENYITSMVEALSIACKDCLERLIQDINNELKPKIDIGEIGVKS